MKKVKVCTNRSLRKAFRSYLGRLLLRGINSTLDLSEKLLYQLTPNPTLELPAIAPPPPTGSPENRRYIKVSLKCNLLSSAKKSGLKNHAMMYMYMQFSRYKFGKMSLL